MLNVLKLEDNPKFSQIMLIAIKKTMPTFLILLAMSFYYFIDQFISIKYANDNYDYIFLDSDQISPKSYIKYSLTLTSMIVLLIEGLTFFFILPTTIRMQHLISKGVNEQEIESFMARSFKLTFFASFFFIAILIGITPTWFNDSYYGDPGAKAIIVKEAVNYSNVLIFTLPIFMFYNYMSYILRSHKYTVVVIIGALTSISTNLLFDFIFMGVLHEHIMFSAIATLISITLGLSIYIIHNFKVEEKYLRFVEWFRSNNNFKKIMITLVGMMYASFPLFIRAFSQIIFEWIQLNNMEEIGRGLYKTKYSYFYDLHTFFNLLINLLMPIMFSVVLGFSPYIPKIIKTNFSIYKLLAITTLMALGVGILIATGALILQNVLTDALGIDNNTYRIKEILEQVLLRQIWIFPIYSLLIGCTSLLLGLNKTILASIIIMIKGFIVMIVSFFIFKEHISFQTWDALENPTKHYDQLFYWWQYISSYSISGVIAIAITIPSLIYFKKKNQIYVDETKIEKWLIKRSK